VVKLEQRKEIITELRKCKFFTEFSLLAMPLLSKPKLDIPKLLASRSGGLGNEEGFETDSREWVLGVDWN